MYLNTRLCGLAAVKGQRFLFCIYPAGLPRLRPWKATYRLDQEFHRNMENAQAAGFDVGVYFFAQAVNEEEAQEEADFVLENLAGYSLQLPVVYDPESILDDEARTDNVTGEQFTKNTQIFCAAMANAGYSPMIYANMLWEAFELDLEYLSEYPLWYADYEPYPQTTLSFWFLAVYQ